jgi:hypothetical protein
MVLSSWGELISELSPLCASDDVFVDLGSGRGALVFQTSIQVAKDLASPNHNSQHTIMFYSTQVPGMICIGVELSKKRHAMALTAHKRLKQLSEVCFFLFSCVEDAVFS